MTQPTEVTRRFYAAWNARDLDGLFDLLAEDVTVSIDSGTIHGPEAVRQYVMGVMHAFPGVRAEVHRVVAETEDTVVTELRLVNPAEDDAEPGAESQVGTWHLAGLTCEIAEVRDGRIKAVTNYYAANEADRTDVELIPSRAEAARIAEEQAALRRVATLVAKGTHQDEVFAAVNQEIARIVGADTTSLVRLEPDGAVTTLAARGIAEAPFAVGQRSRLDPADLATLAGGQPTRIGPAVAVPIVVDGQTWGISFVTTEGRDPFPAGTEARIADFTELVATALVNAQQRAELEQMAAEQAALRRVAELVARSAGQDALFESVAREASQLVGGQATKLLRFDDGGRVTVVGACGSPVPAGTTVLVEEDDTGIAARIRRTGRPVRIDDYAAAGGSAIARDRFGVSASVGVPVFLGDRTWGVLAATAAERLPPETEGRLRQFSELVAAALANAQTRAEVQQLAEEQAALRRVAELVAADVPPEDVLEAVVVEASGLLGEVGMALSRYEPGGGATIVATCRTPVPIGLHVSTEGDTCHAQVLRTGRPYRTSTLAGTPLEGVARELGVDSSVGVPVVAGGRVWGVLTTSIQGSPSVPDTEERLAQFAGLVGNAIANAESRAQLTASRARVVAAANESRRRVQRDVHDGAQQRMVQTVITLKLLRDAIGEPEKGPRLLQEALYHAERATVELRDLVHGILPASLSRGLRPGLESLAVDLPVPVSLDVPATRLPVETETTAYFVVAEALTNVVKHAGATAARVDVVLEDGSLTVRVSDDGAGGADAARGSGLTGLFDRVEAADGSLRIDSPPGAGTVLEATLPVSVVE